MLMFDGSSHAGVVATFQLNPALHHSNAGIGWKLGEETIIGYLVHATKH